MPDAKYAVGDAVKHPAADDKSFPKGTGVVTSVVPDTGDGYSYRVKSDASGKILPVAFKESELSEK